MNAGKEIVSPSPGSVPREWPASDLVVASSRDLSGFSSLAFDPDPPARDLVCLDLNLFTEPPLFCPPPQANWSVLHRADEWTLEHWLRVVDWRNALAAAIRAAIAALTSLLATRFRRPDPSLDLGSVASAEQSLFASAPWCTPSSLFAHLPAVDGAVSASLLGDWTTLAAWAVSEGAPPELAHERWHLLEARRQAAATLFAQLGSWTQNRTAGELTERAQLLRLPWAAVRTVSEAVQDRQLQAREFFSHVRASDGPVWSVPRSPVRFWEAVGLRSGTPRFPRSERSTRTTPRTAHAWKKGPRPGAPLSGLRVIDFTWAVAGPLATRILAGLGAQVLHIVPLTQRVEFDERIAAWLAEGKEALPLDLSTARGRAIASEAIDSAHVVIDNFSPRVMEQWQLGPAALLARVPRLVVVRMPAFGLDGPDRNWVGFGPTLEAWSGYARIFEAAKVAARATLLGAADSDVLNGLFAALGTLAALLAREVRGSGMLVEAAQFEGVSFALGPLFTLPVGLHSAEFSGIRLGTERSSPCRESSRPS